MVNMFHFLSFPAKCTQNYVLPAHKSLTMAENLPSTVAGNIPLKMSEISL